MLVSTAGMNVSAENMERVSVEESFYRSVFSNRPSV